MPKTRPVKNDEYYYSRQHIVQRNNTDAEDEGYHEATWNQLDHYQQSGRSNLVYPTRSCDSCGQMRQQDIPRRNERFTENEPQIETILTCDSKCPRKELVTLCGQPTEVANAFLSLDFVAKRMENRENYNNVSSPLYLLISI